MRARRDASFTAVLKGHVGAITAALSFVAVIMSIVQAWGSNAGAAATAVLAAVSVLLIAYNFWLWRSGRRGPALSAGSPARTLTKRRLALHSLSGIALLVAWGAVGVSVWDHYAVRVLLATLGCDSALPRLEQYIGADGSDDVQARLNLASCYDGVGRPADEVAALEELLADKRALATLGSGEREAMVGRLHGELGVALLVDDVDANFEPQPAKALHHLREARRYDPTNPMVLFTLGFAHAIVHGRDRSSVLEDIERIFADARDKLELASKPPSELTFGYHYWYARSLTQLSAWDSAAREFEDALGALGAAMAGQAQADWRDKIFYELGLIEFSRNENLRAAREWWEQMSSREEIAKAQTFSGLGIWRDGVLAKEEGNAERAAELFNRAEQLLNDALRQGARSAEVRRALV